LVACRSPNHLLTSIDSVGKGPAGHLIFRSVEYDLLERSGELVSSIQQIGKNAGDDAWIVAKHAGSSEL